MDRLPSPPTAAIRTLLGACVELAGRDPEVRDALRSVHSWLGRQLEGAGGPLRDKVVHTADGRRVTSERALPTEPLADLTMVARRARWKAAALRLACDRRAGGEEGLEAVEAGLRETLKGLPECYPWMLDGPMPLPPDGPVRLAAASYDALARVAELGAELEADDHDAPPPTELLYLMAEAQSAILVAVRNLGLRGDSDQRDLFAWLKHQTTVHRIYVDRHMRLDDPADPVGAADLLARADAGAEELRRKSQDRKERQQLLKKLRYHLQRGAQGALLEGDQESIVTALARWKELGLATRDRALSETLAELGGRDDLGDPLRLALGGFEETPAKSEDASRDPNAEARALLKDQSIAGLHLAGDDPDLVGIAEQLDLEGIESLEVSGLSAADEVRSCVQSTSATLILLGIRLDQGAYEALKEACAERDLLFVRLPGGYDRDQVARQILRQVGWRLRRGVEA